jgi:hypothetical protein
MPAHIYIRTGDYSGAAKANVDAVKVDEMYIKQRGSEGVYQAMYYNHNIHFLASVNAMNGNFAEALRRSRQLEANVRPMLKMMPMLETFGAYPLTTLVRFGKWDDILREPEPDKDTTVITSLWHFARGVAFARTGKPSDAERELAAFRESVTKLPVAMPMGNNAAFPVLKVAEEILTGEIALAAGDKTTAVTHLRNAVTAHDGLIYAEPPDWDLPAREFLGRALLLNADYPGAEAVYRAELTKRPNSGRALFGLVESLKKQGKTGEAGKAETQLKRAWANADTKL